MTQVVTFGETMGLFRATSTGALTEVSDFELAIGGADSNVAIGLARLGVPVTWIGRVGDDPIGARILNTIRAEGVTVLGVVDDTAPTALMVKSQSTTEAREVIYYRAGSAGSRLEAKDLINGCIWGAELLHITGITASLSESARDAVFSAIGIAKDGGLLVSFDINHRSALWVDREPAALYARLATLADIVFAGHDEARILFPNISNPVQLASAISKLGPSQVVIKLAAHGCIAIIDDVVFRQAAIPVEVIDTVGAGDAFVAGYLAELVSGRDPRQRLLTAVSAGGLACTHHGDWEGAPTRSQLGIFSPSAAEKSGAAAIPTE